MAHIIRSSVLVLAIAGGIAAQEVTPLGAGSGQPELRISYDPGEGITFDGGKEFSLNLGGQIQVQWYYMNLENGQDINSFQVMRARLLMQGHLFSEDITYLMQTEFTNPNSILDAFGAYRFLSDDSTDMHVRFGLGKFWSGRQDTTYSKNLELVERPVASRTFGNARATGAILEGASIEADDGTKTLHYHFGAINNDLAAGSLATDAQGVNNSDKLNWILGIRWDPQGEMGDLEYREGDVAHLGFFQSSMGAYLTFGNDRVATVDYDSTTINLHGALKTGAGVHAQGEIWIRSDDPENAASADSVGWYGQASYTTAPDSTQYGIAAVISQANIKDAGSLISPVGLNPGQDFPLGAVGATGDVTEFGLVGNLYYHEHRLKTQLGYTLQKASPDGAGWETNHALDLVFTLVF